eukprot:351944-Chlamydomonas_euryale.AAC.1
MASVFISTMHSRDRIAVIIPACHAGDRGSTPRHGAFFFRPALTRATSADWSTPTSPFRREPHALTAGVAAVMSKGGEGLTLGVGL